MSELVSVENIQKKIYTVRGLQVMLDEDLAALYAVDIKALNQAVKRNIERFPESFMFQLSGEEFKSLNRLFGPLKNEDSLRSQIVTLNSRRGKHRKYLPYAFTEQGVAMLSAVLRSETAVRVSIQIINAFVAMRRFLLSNAQVFQRLDSLEMKQIATEKKIDYVLTAIENKSVSPKQGIFYNGQVFDAWLFVSGLIRSAKKSVLLIDNYVDDSVLSLFSKRRKSVGVTILTGHISRQLEIDAKKFNEQYEPLTVRQFNSSHDRFLIIDETDLYHFGASLKDLGKKWFAFSKMEIGAVEMLENLRKGRSV